MPIFFKDQLNEQRKKAPRNKVLLNFFAGKVSFKNTIFMFYEQINYQNPAPYMHLELITALEKIKNRPEPRYRDIISKTEKYGLFPSRIKVSKKQNGINLFETNCDEF